MVSASMYLFTSAVSFGAGACMGIAFQGVKSYVRVGR